MTASNELVKNLTVLSQGREVQEVDLGEVTAAQAPPANAKLSSDADVANVADALVFALAVQLREDAAFKSADITIDTLDDTADYTVDINSTSATANLTAGDSKTDAIGKIAAAINGIAEPVTATAVDADGDSSDDTVHIEGDDAADYTISTSATGSGAMSLEQDAHSVDLEVWAKRKNGDAFCRYNQASFSDVTDNFTEEFGCAQFRALFVRIASISPSGARVSRAIEKGVLP